MSYSIYLNSDTDPRGWFDAGHTQELKEAIKVVIVELMMDDELYWRIENDEGIVIRKGHGTVEA